MSKMNKYYSPIQVRKYQAEFVVIEGHAENVEEIKETLAKYLVSEGIIRLSGDGLPSEESPEIKVFGRVNIVHYYEDFGESGDKLVDSIVEYIVDKSVRKEAENRTPGFVECETDELPAYACFKFVKIIGSGANSGDAKITSFSQESLAEK